MSDTRKEHKYTVAYIPLPRHQLRSVTRPIQELRALNSDHRGWGKGNKQYGCRKTRTFKSQRMGRVGLNEIRMNTGEENDDGVAGKKLVYTHILKTPQSRRFISDNNGIRKN